MGEEEKEKVLIISYYWPPAGGPGVQRWLKFVKYLPDFGVEPIVYIPENPTYPLIDTGLESEVRPETKILKTRILEPYGWASAFSKGDTKKISSGIIPDKKKQSALQRLMLWVRGNLFIPDARVFWVRPSVLFLAKYIREHKIRKIITTGPPHSLHLIGLRLRKTEGIKWVADFRDPWTTIGYHKELKLTSGSAKRHKDLERQVLTGADHIIVTSPTTKAEFEELTNRPVTVITNGYDIEKIDRLPKDEKFTLAHIGSFLSERNPQILWQALSELVAEEDGFSAHFRLKLIGAVSQEVLVSARQSGLEPYIDAVGYVPHSEALQQQRSSQVLLLVEIDSPNTKCIIPGKLFEYMVSERPIIAIGPEGADFGAIVKATNTGAFFTYFQKEELKENIRKLYHEYLQGGLRSHGIGLQQYSRKNLTQQLAELIKQL